MTLKEDTLLASSHNSFPYGSYKKPNQNKRTLICSSCTHFFNLHLSGTYYVPGTVIWRCGSSKAGENCYPGRTCILTSMNLGTLSQLIFISVYSNLLK